MATGYSQELVLASSLTSSDSKSTSKKLPELKSVGSDPVYEDRPLRRNLTPDEREFLELMKSQSILLKFAKMCRLAMHAYKENYLKITVWADCVAFARHCESQKLKASEEYKQVVARIRAQLDTDTSDHQLAPSQNVDERVRQQVAREQRRWSTKQSQQLEAVVADAMLYEAIELELEMEGRRGDHDYRKDLRSKYEVASDSTINSKLAYEVLQEQVNRKSQTFKGFCLDSFWESFWEQIAENMGGNRTGRSCQIHWLHHLHPTMNRSEFWSKAEDSTLLQLVDEIGGGQWGLIADRLGTNRSAFDVFKHYQMCLNTDLVNSKWTEAEKKLLVKYVEKYKTERTRLWRLVAAPLSYENQ